MDLSKVNPPECGILPAQFADLYRSAQPSAEQRLYWEILTDGVLCWLKHAPNAGTQYTTPKWRRKLWAEAQFWIFGDYPPAPSFISFRDCCYAVGINPDWLRDALRNDKAVVGRGMNRGVYRTKNDGDRHFGRGHPREAA
jgi:hypothetical protein